jgi:hypothetical protein
MEASKVSKGPQNPLDQFVTNLGGKIVTAPLVGSLQVVQCIRVHFLARDPLKDVHHFRSQELLNDLCDLFASSLRTKQFDG